MSLRDRGVTRAMWWEEARYKLQIQMPDTRPMFFLPVLVLVVLAFCVLRRARHPPVLPLPPGPTTSWFQRSVTSLYPWLTYAKWTEIYGLPRPVHSNPLLTSSRRHHLHSAPGQSRPRSQLSPCSQRSTQQEKPYVLIKTHTSHGCRSVRLLNPDGHRPPFDRPSQYWF